MSATVRALIVEPGSVTARWQAIDADESPQLAALQELVGGYIEIVSGTGPNGHAWAAFLNEEGRLHGLPPNEAATALLDALGRGVGMVVGTVAFLGTFGGGTLDCPADVARTATACGLTVTGD